MYKDISSNKNYPKTLIIRNHEGGVIWQIYHVQALHEAKNLADNATDNGFQAITLENHQPSLTETWPDWRQTEGGIEIINNI